MADFHPAAAVLFRAFGKQKRKLPVQRAAFVYGHAHVNHFPQARMRQPVTVFLAVQMNFFDDSGANQFVNGVRQLLFAAAEHP